MQLKRNNPNQSEIPLGPGTFAIEASRGRWKPFKHLIIVIELLLYLIQGRFNRLMVFMPPRHGKSTLISQYFLAWFLGTFPDLRVILATHSATFSAKWGRITKQLLKEFGLSLFVEQVKLNQDSSASYRWDIEGHDGGLFTSGVGGSILGEGANGLIIDDPTKGFKKANSKTHQQELNDWVYTEAFTRLDKDLSSGKDPWVIYDAQRLGKKDLAGQILYGLTDDDEGEPHIDAMEALEILRNGGSIPKGTWVVLNLPAIAEENDLLGREPGEALWPEKMDEEELSRIKHDMGSFRFEAIYQGNPREREGKIFKRRWFYDENDNIHPHLILHDLEEYLNSIRYWDFASSEEEGDSAAGFKSSYDELNQKLVFRKLVHGKFSASGMYRKYVKTTVLDGRKIVSIIEQEPGSHSKILISRFRKEKELKGYKIRKDKVQDSKANRAFDLEAMCENGDIQFDADSMTESEIRKAIDELIEFTGADGGEDNIVDTMTGSARYWMEWKNKSRTRVST